MTPHEQLARADDGLQDALRAVFASERGREVKLTDAHILQALASIAAGLSAVRKLENARCQRG